MAKWQVEKKTFPYLCQRNENQTSLHTEQHDEDCCRSLFSKFTKKTNLFTTQKEKLWEQLNKESSEDSQEK